jgi:hypothetical protein
MNGVLEQLEGTPTAVILLGWYCYSGTWKGFREAVTTEALRRPHYVMDGE